MKRVDCTAQVWKRWWKGLTTPLKCEKGDEKGWLHHSSVKKVMKRVDCTTQVWKRWWKGWLHHCISELNTLSKVPLWIKHTVKGSTLDWGSVRDFFTSSIVIAFLSVSKHKKVQTNAYLFWHGHTVWKFSGKSPLSSHRTTLKQQING